MAGSRSSFIADLSGQDVVDADRNSNSLFVNTETDKNDLTTLVSDGCSVWKEFKKLTKEKFEEGEEEHHLHLLDVVEIIRHIYSFLPSRRFTVLLQGPIREAVGKTSLLKRITTGLFDGQYNPTTKNGGEEYVQFELYTTYGTVQFDFTDASLLCVSFSIVFFSSTHG